MTARIALLRAVNVGGTGKLPMAELKASLTRAGHKNVRTLLASGNVVLDVDDAVTSAALETTLEAHLQKSFGLSSEVMVRDAAEWAAVIAHNPFQAQSQRDPSHMLAVFLKAPPTAGALAAFQTARERRPGPELVQLPRPGSRVAYVFYGAGLADSKLDLGRHLGPATGRNWNTVVKLAAFLAA